MTSTPRSPEATPGRSNHRLATAATTVNANPIDCANRFGGPGTSFGAPSRGATTARRQLCERAELRTGEHASEEAESQSTSSQCQPVMSATSAMTATPPATTRAALSLTVSGKPSTDATPPRYRRTATIPTRSIGIAVCGAAPPLRQVADQRQLVDAGQPNRCPGVRQRRRTSRQRARIERRLVALQNDEGVVRCAALVRGWRPPRASTIRARTVDCRSAGGRPRSACS